MGLGMGLRMGMSMGIGMNGKWEIGMERYRTVYNPVYFKDLNASRDFDLSFAIILVLLYTKKSEKL